MRTITNIITIIFVVVSGYFLFSHNARLGELASTYYRQAKTEIQKIGDALPDGTFGKIFTPAPEPIPTATLPGPLLKIEPVTPAPKPVSKPPASTPTQTPNPVPAPAPSGLKLTVSGIIVATNAERVAHSESTLKESAKLDASAKVKANDILARQYFEHTSPDGKTVSDLVGAQGYRYIKIGENLALGDFKSDTDVVTAWMNSPGHRANILDAAFTEIGVGVAYGSYQGRMVYVAVQHFGRPIEACPTIDATLKAKVDAGQADLAALSGYLENLKKAIDEGRAQGKNMDDMVTIYNQTLERYQAEYKIVESERIQYNAEVAAFNACASQ